MGTCEVKVSDSRGNPVTDTIKAVDDESLVGLLTPDEIGILGKSSVEDLPKKHISSK